MFMFCLFREKNLCCNDHQAMIKYLFVKQINCISIFVILITKEAND